MHLNALCKAGKQERFCTPISKIVLVMQLTSILLLAACLQVSATAYAQKVTITEKNVSLRKVFKEIRKQTGYNFIYSNKTIRQAVPITLDVKNGDLQKVLNECFAGQPLTYSIEDKIIIVSPRSPATIPLILPDKEIRGQVTDSATGKLLVGVTIKVKGGSTGTVTDANGLFSLDVPDDAVLEVSYLGYAAKEISVNGRSSILISLAATATGLNQLVVVGYGTQKKSDLTGSIVSVKGEDIAKSPAINVAGSLAGQLPGVIINSPTGEPGRDDPSIYIRGMSTTGNTSPLVIIDGVERGGLGQLNPNDIASISVLKDASAAIYGAEAANGVILVTTKKGSLGSAPKIDFSYDEGLSQPTRNPVMANSYTFAQVSNEINAQQGLAPAYSATDLAKYKTGNDPNYPNTNWYNFIVKNWTPPHRAKVTVSGGPKSTT